MCCCCISCTTTLHSMFCSNSVFSLIVDIKHTETTMETTRCSTGSFSLSDLVSSLLSRYERSCFVSLYAHLFPHLYLHLFPVAYLNYRLLLAVSVLHILPPFFCLCLLHHPNTFFSIYIRPCLSFKIHIYSLASILRCLPPFIFITTPDF